MTANNEIAGYMDYLVNQVFHANTIVPDQRPMEIYLDTEYNATNLSNSQMLYAIYQLHTIVNNHFTLLTPTVFCSQPLVVFPIVYGVMIFGGLITNALMIFAFFRAEKLRTFRNVFIINLAIR